MKSVLEVKTMSDRVMKTEIGGVMMNIVSAYAPQGCELEEREFLES